VGVSVSGFCPGESMIQTLRTCQRLMKDFQELRIFSAAGVFRVWRRIKISGIGAGIRTRDVMMGMGGSGMCGPDGDSENADEIV
jgi:hypothetical protein